MASLRRLAGSGLPRPRRGAPPPRGGEPPPPGVVAPLLPVGRLRPGHPVRPLL